MTNILQSHFLNLYAMALSDTQIDTVELEVLCKIGQEKGVEKSEIDHLILNPDKVKFSFPESLDEKIIYLYDFAKIIYALFMGTEESMIYSFSSKLIDGNALGPCFFYLNLVLRSSLKQT
jgi:hypothetical protein